MISNALVWLSMKLVNLIATRDDPSLNLSPLSAGAKLRELAEYWEVLDEEIRVWHDGLPGGFHPTAIHIAQSEYGTEMWFPRPMCASTIQWYNLCRIQLLQHHLSSQVSSSVQRVLGPETPGISLARRQASYAVILAQSRSHAKEIVAIELGRHDEGTRIHAVQPLWMAGSVLGNEYGAVVGKDVEVDCWRRTILGLLRGIERDTGWASEYRVRNLLEVWGGLPCDWPESPSE